MRGAASYVGRVTFLKYLSPFRAINDLRAYLAQRSKYELLFFVLSVVITGGVIAGFIVDSRVERPYTREIIWAESWPENRTRLETMRAQQAQMAEDAREYEALEAARAKRRAEFQRLENRLDAWGL